MNAKKTQKTWRWLRISFSLRSLLVFTFLFAAVLGSWIASAHRQGALMKRLEDHCEESHLSLNVDYASSWGLSDWLPATIKTGANQHYWSRPESISFSSFSGHGARTEVAGVGLMRAIAKIPSIRKVDFDDLVIDHSNLSLLQYSQIEDLSFGDIEFIGKGPTRLPTNLKKLVLGRCSDTHLVFAAIRGLTELRSFTTWYCVCTDEQLLNVLSCKSLEELSFKNGRIASNAITLLSNDCLKQIGQLRKLKKLELQFDSDLDDGTVEAIATLSLLEDLTIPSSGLSKQGFASLVQCQSLKRLGLFGRPKVEDSLAALSELKTLRTIDFHRWNGPVSERIINGLCSLPLLESIDVGEVPYALKACLRLRKSATFRGVLHDGAVEDNEESLHLLLGGKTKEGFYNFDFVKLDGMVDVSGQLEQLPLATHLKDVELRETDIGDDDLKSICQIERLLTLNIASTKITDKGLDHLSTLSNLRSLNARGLGITFEKLPPLPSLSQLSISGSHLTLEGCIAISQLPCLSELAIEDAVLHEAMLDEIAKAAVLTKIRLIDCHLQKDSVASLAACKSLNALILDGSHINNTSPGFEALTGISGLSLDQTNTTDEGASKLSKLGALIELSLQGSEITDATLEVISGLTSLTDVDIRDTLCTGRGIKALEKLPVLKRLNCVGMDLDDAILGGPLMPTFVDYRLQRRFTEANEPVIERFDDWQLVIGQLDLTLARIQSILDSDSLRYLDLSDSKISDSTLAQILEYKKLISLSLARTQIGDAGIARLSSSQELVVLDLTETKVSDKAMEILVSLPNLERLNLSKTQITIEGLRTLRPISKQIIILNLMETDIDVGALKELEHWTNLRELNLGGNSIRLTDCMDKLPIEHLEKLAVGDCELDRGGIDFVLRQNPLRSYLMIKGDYWTEDRVQAIAGNRALIAIDIDGLPFTEGMAEVLSSIPHLQIVRWKNTSLDASLIKKLRESRFLRSVEFENTRLEQSHIDALVTLEPLRKIVILKTDSLERLDWSSLASLAKLDELVIQQSKLDRTFEKELKRTFGKRLRVVR